MNNFKINSVDEFTNIVDTSQDRLTDILSNKASAYTKYSRAKKDGIRHIYAIKSNHELYQIQKKLNARFLQNILLPESVFGFRKGKSYYEFLQPHVSTLTNRYYLRLDISDFFDTIKTSDVRKALDYYISDDVSDIDKNVILDSITSIISLNDRIIQGAITSPVISNIVFRNLDIRIERYCKTRGIIYSRYADDMLFSSGNGFIHNYKFINAIKSILRDKDFTLNYSKTLKFKNEISLNGYVVGTSIRLSRKKLRKLNELIFNIGKSSFQGFKNESNKFIFKNKLAGYRSYLIQSIRYIEDEHKIKQTENKIKSIESAIEKIM